MKPKLDPTLKRFILFFSLAFLVFVGALIYANHLGSAP